MNRREYTRRVVEHTVEIQEPWGATIADFHKAWTIAEREYRQLTPGIADDEALFDDVIRIHAADGEIVLRFETKEDAPKPTAAQTAEAVRLQLENDKLRAEQAALYGALHTMWLETNWQWVTSKMTSEQRDAAAHAVETHHAAQDDDREPFNIRWWNE